MQTRKKILFIVNPISGTASKEAALKLIPTLLPEKDFEIHIAYTTHAGHASQIASQAVIDKMDIVVAVGGDGTVNEVARSLVHTDVILAILPFGSGNGLARHIQIPMESRGALNLIKTGRVFEVDYGKINEIPFFCTCGVGFDAFVSAQFAKASKRGMVTYMEKTLNEYLNYKPQTYQVIDEGGEMQTHNAFLITCANASQWGNNAYIAPNASLRDGVMDIIILEPFTALDIPSLTFQLFNKLIDHNSRIKTFKTKKVLIKRQSPGVIHFDGDPMETTANVEVEIISKGLKVIGVHKKKKENNVILYKLNHYFYDLPFGREK